MRDSIDLMSDMGISAFDELNYLDAERKDRYREKQESDAAVEAGYRKLGKLSQFDTFVSCTQVATSICLSLALGGAPAVLAGVSAAFGGANLIANATGAFEWLAGSKDGGATLKGGFKLLTIGAGIAGALTGPVAASKALQSALEPMLTGSSMVTTAAQGVSSWYRGNLEVEKAGATNASTQFQAELAQIGLRSEETYAGIEEGTASHETQWETFISAMNQEAAARRRAIQRGR